MSACAEFRERLAASLVGRPAPPLPNVRWHEHLLGCAACRALLEAEEALELVLAGLPAPALPDELAERVLARLADARGVTLERLLELDAVPASPGLSERVLAGLAAERERADAERRLDALLARVPAPAAPADLAERTLAALAAGRAGVAAPADAPRARLARLRGGLGWIAAAAAAALLAALAWRLTQPDAPARDRGADGLALPGGTPRVALGTPEPQGRATRGGGDARGAAPAGPGADADAPDAELLAALDVLERWDLLVDEDVAVLLASVDPVEEELLDLAHDADEEDEG